jgi:homoserine O-succinyltransferase
MSVLSHDQATIARGARLPPIGLGTPPPAAPLRIAVVNNMSGAALHTAERQICALLKPASAGMLVDLRFYVLPGAVRSKATAAHIDSCYDSLKALEDSPPDGLIVTGAEPQTSRFESEWFWPAMTRLIDWVDDARVSTVWSCLAAHAAVYHRDGIERIPLATKLSGVFECSLDTPRHQLLHRLPHKWRVPHSRRNGLSRSQLERHGYEILSWSPEVTVDMFVRQDRSLQLHLQGHPEYEACTLIAEYRRDLQRLRDGAAAGEVTPPVGIWSKSDSPGLPTRLRSSMLRRSFSRARPTLDDELAGELVPDYWSCSARRLFGNWLAYLDASRSAEAAQPSRFARAS